MVEEGTGWHEAAGWLDPGALELETIPGESDGGWSEVLAKQIERETEYSEF